MALGGGAVDGLQVPIEGDSSGLNAALGSATDSLGNFRTAVGLAGAALAGLAAKGLSSAVTAAADFEQAMANVEKVTNAEVAAEMRSELMEMAETIPLTTSELAELAAQAGRMGAEGTEEVAAFTEVAAEMGAATVMSAENAGTALGKLSTALNTPLSDIRTLGDAINEVSNNFATDSEEIVDATQRAGQVLTNLGMRSDEVIGLAGAFNELSPTSRLAASRMQQIGEALMDPGTFETLGGAIGVSAEGFAELVEEDPTETMYRVLEAVDQGEVSFQDLEAVMTKHAARAFRDTAGDVDLMRDAVETSNGAMENAGSLAKEVAVETDTAQGQWQLLKNRANNLAIQIGDNLLPYIRDFLAEVTKLVDRFSRVNEATDGWAGTLILLGSLIAGLITAGGALVSMMGGLSAVAGTLTAGFTGIAAAVAAVSAPMLALIGVVAALAAAFYTDFAGIRTATEEVVGVFMERLQPAIEWLEANGVPIANSIKEAFIDFATTVEPYLSPLVDILKEGLIAGINLLFDTLETVIPPIIEFLADLDETAAPYVQALADAFDAVKTAVEGAVAKAEEVLAPFLEWLGEQLPAAETDTLKPFADAWDAIKEAVVDLDARAREVLGPFVEWLAERWTEIDTRVIQPWRLAFENIATKMGEFVARIREILSPFFTWLQERTAVVLDAVTRYFTNLKEDLEVVWNGMIAALTTAWDLFGDEILTILEFYIDLVKSVWRGLWNGLLTILETFALLLQGEWSEAWDTVKTYLEDTFDGILSFAREWGGRFLEWVGGLVDDVIQWFKDLATDLVGSSIIPDMFADILSALTTFASDFLSDLGTWAGDVVSDVTSMMEDALAEITGAFSDWLQAGKDLVDELAGGIRDKLQAMKDAADHVVSGAKDTIDGFKSKFKSAGKALGSSLASGLTSAKKKAARAARGVADKVRGYFNDSDADEGPLASTVAAGEALPATLAKGIEDNITAVERAARNVANTAKKVLNPTVSPTGGHAVPYEITAGAVEKAADAVQEATTGGSGGGESVVEAVSEAVNTASEDSVGAVEAVADAVRETVPDRDPLSSKFRGEATQAVADAVANNAAAPTTKEVVEEGDEIHAEVIIEGDADRHDVERGLSRALQSYNLDR